MTSYRKHYGGFQQPFARLALESYKQQREVEGYRLLKKYSTVDRVVFQHEQTGDVVISFRGTNPKNWRDVTTDVAMVVNAPRWSNRFRNAERVTKQLVDEFGAERVTAVGHSLGGSQALHVSNKYGIKAHAFNPYIMSSQIVQQESFPLATIHTNISDPIAGGTLLVESGKKDFRFNTKAWPWLGQHGIANFIEPKHAYRPAVIATPKPTATLGPVRYDSVFAYQ
jgi:pimeloyl-ACP methyl ester carboxylesterase